MCALSSELKLSGLIVLAVTRKGWNKKVTVKGRKKRTTGTWGVYQQGSRGRHLIHLGEWELYQPRPTRDKRERETDRRREKDEMGEPKNLVIDCLNNTAGMRGLSVNARGRY